MKALLLFLLLPMTAGVAGEAGVAAGAPTCPTPAAMHAEFVRRFEETPGFGPSRLVRPPFSAPAPALVWNGTTYQVPPPELIGLEEEPVVYAPRAHPGPGDGRVRPTNLVSRELRQQDRRRHLSPLETNAVQALRAGRDLVVVTNRVVLEDESARLTAAADLLVVGALRAGAACAKCHQCKEGTLLGAFSYHLTPVQGLPAGALPPPVTRSKHVSGVGGPLPGRDPAGAAEGASRHRLVPDSRQPDVQPVGRGSRWTEGCCGLVLRTPRL